jgi:uncharacterized protein (DUF427 family)
MLQLRGPAPGFQRNPDHRIAVRPSREHWQVSKDGQLLADSRRALLLDESRYGTVVYFPPEDVKLDLLRSTDSRTTCPFKGEADYLAMKSSASGTDIAWRYRHTFDEVADIAGYIAFYEERTTITQQSPDTQPEEPTRISN